MSVSKKDLTKLNNFIFNIYEKYLLGIGEYISAIKTNPKKNRLQFISNFINSIILKIIDSANETQIIKKIVLPDNDISINKTAKYKFVIKIIDSIENIENCNEFGSIFSIIDDKKNIIMAGCLRYSYLTELVISKKKTTELYYFVDSFKKIKNIKIPNSGKTYIVNESKQKIWKDYHFHQFLEKIKSTHQLIFNRSLVSNFLHIITKGGVLLYPADLENQNGHIELVFEAVPLAFIMNNCGGITKDSEKNILDIPYPVTKKKIKQKTNFITGGITELTIFNDVINPSLVFFD